MTELDKQRIGLICILGSIFGFLIVTLDDCGASKAFPLWILYCFMCGILVSHKLKVRPTKVLMTAGFLGSLVMLITVLFLLLIQSEGLCLSGVKLTIESIFYHKNLLILCVFFIGTLVAILASCLGAPSFKKMLVSLTNLEVKNIDKISLVFASVLALLTQIQDVFEVIRSFW